MSCALDRFMESTPGRPRNRPDEEPTTAAGWTTSGLVNATKGATPGSSIRFSLPAADLKEGQKSPPRREQTRVFPVRANLEHA